MNRSSEPGKPNAAQSEIAQHGPVAHAGDAVGYGFAARASAGARYARCSTEGSVGGK